MAFFLIPPQSWPERFFTPRELRFESHLSLYFLNPAPLYLVIDFYFLFIYNYNLQVQLGNGGIICEENLSAEEAAQSQGTRLP